jgi:RimJ/RimL family protein N-acetyltransferase
MASWLERAPPDEIDAGRVRLRRWRLEEAEVLRAVVIASLEHLRPWMPWAQQAPSLEEQRAFLAYTEQAWQERAEFVYAVTLPSDEPIGGMGLHTRQVPGTLEIGYWLAVAHTGRGYATAAAGALTEAAFALPGVERVEIRCDEANRASAAIPARLGYRLERVIDRERTAPGDTGRGLVWAMERDAWLESSRRSG